MASLIQGVVDRITVSINEGKQNGIKIMLVGDSNVYFVRSIETPVILTKIGDQVEFTKGVLGSGIGNFYGGFKNHSFG